MRLVILLAGLLAVVSNNHLCAQSYTPFDPVVIEAVDKLLDQLENSGGKTYYSTGASPHSGAYGELALAAYAHFKVRHNPNNPVVLKGIKASQEFVRRIGEKGPMGGAFKSNYQAAICALLLAEVDHEKYERELRRIIDFFKSMQFRNGGYSYPDRPTGDVSQTQYVMLALWKLDRIGLRIDDDGVAKTGNWLVAVQDQSGGWPYQGVVPPGGQRIKQTGVTASMGVAGGSAVLIAGDILRAWGQTFGESIAHGIPDLPKAINLYVPSVHGDQRQKRATLSSQKLKEAIEEGDKFLLRNSPDPGKLESEWPYYQLYTLERYMSFRDVALELESEESPQWYNGGVKFILKHMGSGGLPKSVHSASMTSNSFAILFLIRSTQRSIAEASAGSAVGGWGLPDDTSEVKVDGANIKGKEVATSVTDLLSVLESDGADELAGKSIPDNLQLAAKGKERTDQLNRLERLARGSQSWQARRVAMRLLAQSDDMDRVPTLIFGLSDPDSMVKIYARDGLRFISRKFDGYELPRKPNDGEIYAAQRKWKEWYLTMRPEYIFLD